MKEGSTSQSYACCYRVRCQHPTEVGRATGAGTCWTSGREAAQAQGKLRSGSFFLSRFSPLLRLYSNFSACLTFRWQAPLPKKKKKKKKKKRKEEEEKQDNTHTQKKKKRETNERAEEGRRDNYLRWRGFFSFPLVFITSTLSSSSLFLFVVIVFFLFTSRLLAPSSPFAPSPPFSSPSPPSPSFMVECCSFVFSLNPISSGVPFSTGFRRTWFLSPPALLGFSRSLSLSPSLSLPWRTSLSSPPNLTADTWAPTQWLHTHKRPPLDVRPTSLCPFNSPKFT